MLVFFWHVWPCCCTLALTQKWLVVNSTTNKSSNHPLAANNSVQSKYDTFSTQVARFKTETNAVLVLSPCFVTPVTTPNSDVTVYCHALQYTSPSLQHQFSCGYIYCWIMFMVEAQGASVRSSESSFFCALIQRDSFPCMNWSLLYLPRTLPHLQRSQQCLPPLNNLITKSLGLFERRPGSNRLMQLSIGMESLHIHAISLTPLMDWTMEWPPHWTKP